MVGLVGRFSPKGWSLKTAAASLVGAAAASVGAAAFSVGGLVGTTTSSADFTAVGLVGAAVGAVQALNSMLSITRAARRVNNFFILHLLSVRLVGGRLQVLSDRSSSYHKKKDR